MPWIPALIRGAIDIFLIHFPGRGTVRRRRLDSLWRCSILVAVLFSAWLALAGVSLHAQEASGGLPLKFSLTFATSDSILTLAATFIEPGSERFVVDSTFELERERDYILDHGKGILYLLPAARRKLDSTRTIHRLVYRVAGVPRLFRDKYFHRKLVVRSDTTLGDSVQVASAPVLDMPSIFGPNIRKSGSIVRGFTIGSNRDMTLNSGFRMQFSGKLAENVDIVAALTDENTPIQPEGNTQTLQEIDRVFVNIKSPNFDATFGDFFFTVGGTEFGRYSRKLKGAMGGAQFADMEFQVSGAVLKGTYYTNKFNGQDGVQGPYRLTGKNGEQLILVIAGSEKVYIDGVRMTRGEQNDYIIEYSSGEITFTPTRLITSNSRITVDFEYADRQYSRSFFGTRGGGSLFDGNVSIKASYLREAEDPDSPIDLSLSDEDKELLRKAGDDPMKASRNGVTLAGRDSLGNPLGRYVKVDTVINGEPFIFYRYDPDSPDRIYNVYFSVVGQGKGDYIRETLGRFRFVGKGRGSYLPIRFLPLPRLSQLVDFNVTASPTRDVSVTIEGALSNTDLNRFSDLDSDDDNGTAWKAELSWKPKAMSLFGANVGDLDVQLMARTIEARFKPIDRINEIEFNRNWNLQSAAPSREVLREARIGYHPTSTVTVSGHAGSIERGGYTTLRTGGAVRATDDSLPKIDYTVDYLKGNGPASSIASSWFKQKGNASYRMGMITPRLFLENERREESAGDTLTPGSFYFMDVQPGIELGGLGPLTLSADLGWRTEDEWHEGILRHASDAFQQKYGLRLDRWNDFRTNVSVTVRDKKYTEEFRRLGRGDYQTILGRWQSNYQPLKRGIDLDFYYQVATERTARKEVVFLRVEKGTGTYKFLGDLNNNGISEENEFERTLYDGDFIRYVVPTEQLFPTIDLKTNTRARIKPRLFMTGRDFWSRFLSSLALETQARLEEKSTDETSSNVYLMRFGTFLNDSTTLFGYQSFRNDLYLFETTNGVSVRLRYSQSRGLNQYALSRERSFRNEKALRVRLQLVREITNQTDVSRYQDNVSTTQASNRARQIAGTDVKTEFSYRPQPEIEVGLSLRFKTAIDNFPQVPVEADINEQSFRFTYAFFGSGRLRLEIVRADITLANATQTIPFELTDGKFAGKNWSWRLSGDYRITRFLQATLNYFGRSEPGNQVIHTARAEVRAFF